MAAARGGFGAQHARRAAAALARRRRRAAAAASAPRVAASRRTHAARRTLGRRTPRHGSHLRQCRRRRRGRRGRHDYRCRRARRGGASRARRSWDALYQLGSRAVPGCDERAGTHRAAVCHLRQQRERGHLPRDARDGAARRHARRGRARCGAQGGGGRRRLSATEGAACSGRTHACCKAHVISPERGRADKEKGAARPGTARQGRGEAATRRVRPQRQRARAAARGGVAEAQHRAARWARRHVYVQCLPCVAVPWRGGAVLLAARRTLGHAGVPAARGPPRQRRGTQRAASAAARSLLWRRRRRRALSKDHALGEHCPFVWLNGMRQGAPTALRALPEGQAALHHQGRALLSFEAEPPLYAVRPAQGACSPHRHPHALLLLLIWATLSSDLNACAVVACR
jgi:hypothetical protein